MPKAFLLSPAAKDYLWGGSKLKTDFNKDIDIEPLAETWECSTHKDGLCVVKGGEFDGKTLRDVLREHPEYAGSDVEIKDGELPILVKFIDAEQKLSVQVHPNNEYAYSHENGSLGKNELWYVVDADSDSKLVFGLSHSCSAKTIRKAIENGSLERYLNRVQIHKDDVFFITAGTIHALGKGAVIAEIQQSSNVTYRLYDYNRIDKNGQKRPLHIDKALDVANLKGGNEARQPMRVLHYKPGFASELLCQSPYFIVERFILNTDINSLEIPLESISESFRVLLCTEGEAVLSWGSGTEAIAVRKGDCVFVPAGTMEGRMRGRAKLLCARC